VDAATLWSALLPQLGQERVPEPSGTRTTAVLAWTLYSVDVVTPAGTLAVEVGLAEREGRTYLVLVQGLAEEIDALREQVFLPAIDALVPLGPEPTPDPATLPYAVEEVAFGGGEDGITLAGTLTRPRSHDPVPAVILMSGSGPQDRDESLAPASLIKPFALIADALTRAGVAVLRYDDRGVGASTGEYASATVAQLTADGRAALDYLAGRPDIDAERIGLLGHSEGGIYAASLGAADPRVAFIVALAAPAVDGVSLLEAQYEAMTRAAGSSEDEVAAALRHAERFFPLVLAGDIEAAEAVLRESLGEAWDRQPEETRALLGEREVFVETQVAAQLPSLGSDWFRSLLASDAGRDWGRVKVPVLGVFGGRDVQVVAAQNEPALRAALAAAGNTLSRTVVLPTANHLFQDALTGAVTEYGTLPAEFTPELLPLVTEWVTEQTRVTAG
jgi:hypothetical protein